MVAQVDKNFSKLAGGRLVVRWLSYLFYEGRPLTTKGRWFNFFVFLLYRIQSRIPEIKDVASPVFVLGTGRSGTTILGVTLGIHPDVGFLNEPKAAWAYAYSNEDLIGSYNCNDARYFLSESDCPSKTKRVIRRIYSHYLAVTRSQRVVDKYPELVFRIGFVKEIFPDAKFIFLYRNGNDTVASIENWSDRLGVDDGSDRHDWWGVNDRKWNLLCEQVVSEDENLKEHYNAIKEYGNHQHRAAVEWILTMQQGMKMLKRYPDEVYPVRYEDYVSDESVRAKLLMFCGLKESSVYVDYCSAVLSPAKRVQHVDLPSEISDVYYKTMLELGYAD